MNSRIIDRHIHKILGTDNLSEEVSNILSNDAEDNSKLRDFVSKIPSLLEAISGHLEQNNALAEKASEALDICQQGLAQSQIRYQSLSHTINIMLDCFGELLLIFNKDGICQTLESKASTQLLGVDPLGIKIQDLFNISENECEIFLDWFKYLLDPRLDFTEMSSLGPTMLQRGLLSLSVKFKPMMIDARVAGVVVILSDNSAQLEADKNLKKMASYNEMVMKYFNDRETFTRFLNHYRQDIQKFKNLVQLQQIPNKNDILRSLHTIKGCAGTLFMEDIKSLVHRLETDIIIAWKPEIQMAELYSKISELAEALESGLNNFNKENRHLLGINNQSELTDVSFVSRKAIENHYNLILQTGDLLIRKSFVQNILTTPAINLLTPLEQSVFSVARRLDKVVEVVIQCPPEIRILSQAYRDLFSALVHVTNNAVDHGIETPELRYNLNKSPTGLIKINVSVQKINTEKEMLILEFIDDGKGIDPQVIRSQLLKKLGFDACNESDEQVIYHIFDIGFSTNSSLSEVSGRGIGMNAVQEEVQKMGGQLVLSSILNKGTHLKISVPLIVEFDGEIGHLLAA